jgi:hypothetical protein
MKISSGKGEDGGAGIEKRKKRKAGALRAKEKRSNSP